MPVFALFDPAGPIAGQERDLIVNAVLLMLIIVIPVLILFYAFAWKYRAGNKKGKYDSDKKHGPWSEVVLWAMPAAIVAVLAVFTWRSAHALDPSRPIAAPTPGASGSAAAIQPLEVQVIALPWKWLFIYPAQHIATVNILAFPAGTPIHFDLTADGPISSFWIPQLGTQIYAMAAMQTQLNLIASTTGTFTGRDTEINGAGYAGMTFEADSVSQSDFDAWVASVKQEASVLNAHSYSLLAMPSEDNPPTYYGSVQGDIFDGIMRSYMMPSSTGIVPMPIMQ